MKNLVFLQIVILLFMAGCKSDSPTNNNANQITYGPKDPSFENGTDWVYNDGSERTNFTGTFMPTKGIWYAMLRLSSGRLYQDNVNLSKSSILIIDWEASHAGANESFKITFSANGTQVLKEIFFGPLNLQKSNDTINLPQLPDPGRLSFICEQLGSPIKIYIDNIRAE